MEQDLIQEILEGFSVFESLLILALWKCLAEIRQLYQGHIQDKQKAFTELGTQLQQCRYTLAELRTHVLQSDSKTRNRKIPVNENRSR